MNPSITAEVLAKKIIELGQKRCSGHILIFDEATLVQLINKELIEYDSMMKELFGANSSS